MTFHDDIASRLDDLRQREAAHRAERLRQIEALGKHVTFTLTITVFGLLALYGAFQAEAHTRTQDLINQENVAWRR